MHIISAVFNNNNNKSKYLFLIKKNMNKRWIKYSIYNSSVSWESINITLQVMKNAIRDDILTMLTLKIKKEK